MAQTLISWQTACAAAGEATTSIKLATHKMPNVEASRSEQRASIWGLRHSEKQCSNRNLLLFFSFYIATHINRAWETKGSEAHEICVAFELHFARFRTEFSWQLSARSSHFRPTHTWRMSNENAHTHTHSYACFDGCACVCAWVLFSIRWLSKLSAAMYGLLHIFQVVFHLTFK